MKKIKRLVATVGEYKDKEGNVKKQYLTVGHIFKKDDGNVSFKIDSIPVNFNGWLNAYDIEEKQAINPIETENKQQPLNIIPDTDLPF